ncbi:diaminobutyrate acetyltransferase [Kutzneria albida]|uniref:L-2,4-diaminobutyric acid acetyltransferase n=2 Tax=Kutzneria TaxID=43356 RepID=W5W6S6_9PSEU|nr:diaminobutyrate acetyltransferase [Kutzneria albida]AHH96465.1 hypothetical protein KALB_3097 [Kutzneria albida DSM 43870]
MLDIRTKHVGGIPNPAGTAVIDRPELSDGRLLWRIARDSQVLDVNSPYAYLLWTRDFADTTVVARVGTEVVGFVSGYLRPDAPDTLVVWQVAVDSAHRGRGLARQMLDELVTRVRPKGARFLETTITADNDASNRLFSAFARAQGAHHARSTLFTSDLFPDGHDAEELHRIGPWPATTTQ